MLFVPIIGLWMSALGVGVGVVGGCEGIRTPDTVVLSHFDASIFNSSIATLLRSLIVCGYLQSLETLRVQPSIDHKTRKL
ncbi:hypothetical protein L6452_00451 [Arctium lappa]|uniref:Uncharacterized protein n=1 Tax=Arctium lappa TaxID=4217 RepID=A0ACB9FDW7_ARCLA|nr:hypothetical protein L6452_00451 [Arctium lappa]